MPNMKNGKRDYKRQYEKYGSREDQKKNRAQRNAARRKLMKAGKVRKGDGKDVGHKKAISRGGSNGDGLKVQSRGSNRSFARNKNGGLKSETSKRERKRK